jgi:hypothetical protein
MPRIATLLGDATKDVRRWARREGRTLPEETRELVLEALAARARGPYNSGLQTRLYNSDRITVGRRDRTAAARRMVGFRIPPELLEQVDEAARANGLTRSAEIHQRLEASLLVDQLDDATLAQLDRHAAEGVSRVDLMREVLASGAAAGANGEGAAA